jgi:hypothetical protein
MPKDGEIDYEKIASFELNGGQIKNAILSAARKMVATKTKLSTELIVTAATEEKRDAEKLLKGEDHS